jgi:ribosomal protein L14
MILRLSWLNISDNTNVRWLQAFHLYKGWKRKSTSLSFFVKGSARVVEPPRIEYKGFKFKFSKKGDICRSILVQTSYLNYRFDGSSIILPSNNGFLLKKKQDLRSKYIFGPVSKTFKRKKFKTLFKKII